MQNARREKSHTGSLEQVAAVKVPRQENAGKLFSQSD